MNERMKKIMDFERQLLQDRMQLQHLIEESEFSDSEIMKSKIQNFKREIEYMELQLEHLKSVVEAKIHVQNVNPVFEEPVPKTVAPALVEKPEPIEIQKSVLNMSVKEKVKDKDLEKAIGKSLMGVFASVLIFISLILFATLMLPYFNDTAKMITMYLVSFAFVGVGLHQLQKDEDNKFYLALTGCGVGAVYISLLVTNMYFKAIGDIALYVLIGIWAIAVCFLAKVKHNIFKVIGQAGITISIIFGCVLCMLNEDLAKFVALIVFYLIAEGAFYVVHYEHEFKKNLVHHVFNVINLIWLWSGCEELCGADFHIITLIMLVICAVHIGLTLYSRLVNAGVSFGIVVSIYTYIFMAIMDMLVKEDNVLGSLIYLIAAVLLAIIEWKEAKNKAGKTFAQIAMIVFAAYGLAQTDYYGYGLIILVVFPLLGLGYYRVNNVLKYGAASIFAIFQMVYGLGDVERFWLGTPVIAVTFVLIYKFKEQYDVKLKNIMHVLAVLFLSFAVEDVMISMCRDIDVAHMISRAVVTIFNIAMLKSCFGTNLATGKPEKCTAYNIINTIFMISGLKIISDANEGFVHLAIIIITLIAFMVNVKNLLDKRDNIWAGIYVGLKFAVLMIVIMNSFNSANYMISIACFILAILSVVIGFKFQYKSLRIFGLVLSMISTFKLIMVDISYANTLGNALSFFASGVLCFVMSLIYNYIDGKMQKKE